MYNRPAIDQYLETVEGPTPSHEWSFSNPKRKQDHKTDIFTFDMGPAYMCSYGKTLEEMDDEMNEICANDERKKEVMAHIRSLSSMVQTAFAPERDAHEYGNLHDFIYHDEYMDASAKLSDDGLWGSKLMYQKPSTQNQGLLPKYGPSGSIGGGSSLTKSHVRKDSMDWCVHASGGRVKATVGFKKRTPDSIIPWNEIDVDGALLLMGRQNPDFEKEIETVEKVLNEAFCHSYDYQVNPGKMNMSYATPVLHVGIKSDAESPDTKRTWVACLKSNWGYLPSFSGRQWGRCGNIPPGSKEVVKWDSEDE